METNRDVHQAKLKAQLDEWGARLDGLKAKAAKAEAGAKNQLHQAADELGKLQESAKKQLAELSAASGQTWMSVKTGVDEAWAKVTSAVEATWKKVV